MTLFVGFAEKISDQEDGATPVAASYVISAKVTDRSSASEQFSVEIVTILVDALVTVEPKAPAVAIPDRILFLYERPDPSAFVSRGPPSA